MAKKLNDKQLIVLKYLADSPIGQDLTWLTYGWHAHRSTLQSLRNRGLIAIENNLVTITDAGKAELAALDSTAEAQPAAGSDAFQIGDKVVIRKDAIVEHVAFIADELAVLRDNQVQGEVISIREYPNGDPIKVQFPKEYYFFTPDELTLWKPAGDADTERDKLRAALEKALWTLNTDFDISLRVRRTKELLNEALAEPVE